ncbi:hypothetical protein BN1708_008989 [Verticillium longisporum]|uniref:Uncharacterized protein n=1 Tax=Verticillium longisporum TaxID=100787 RepID=A0A0G4KD72_VERLO|nr:hypothetical protein BN1708_008989 [Verticillium longisporum]
MFNGGYGEVLGLVGHFRHRSVPGHLQHSRPLDSTPPTPPLHIDADGATGVGRFSHAAHARLPAGAAQRGGIPPPIVPLVFAGMGGAVSPTALDIAQQYIASQGHGAHLQLMSTQGGQRSPEHRRDSQSHGYGPYTGVPSTPVSAPGPHGYAAYPGSPQTRGRAQTLSSTGSTGRAVGPSSNLPSLNTGAPPAGQSQSSMHGHVHGGHAPSQQLSGQQESQQQQQSPGIYFHHWQPPTSLAGSSNQPATPSGASNKSKRKRDSL